METLGLTVPEAARQVTVHPQTIRKLIREGALPAVRIGRRVVIPRAALARWLEEQVAADGR